MHATSKRNLWSNIFYSLKHCFSSTDIWGRWSAYSLHTAFQSINVDYISLRSHNIWHGVSHATWLCIANSYALLVWHVTTSSLTRFSVSICIHICAFTSIQTTLSENISWLEIGKFEMIHSENLRDLTLTSRNMQCLEGSDGTYRGIDSHRREHYYKIIVVWRIIMIPFTLTTVFSLLASLLCSSWSKAKYDALCIS